MFAILLVIAVIRSDTRKIITVLAEKGELTPKEADSLRNLAELRKSLIHGRVDLNVTLKDLDFLSDIAARVARAR